MTLQEISDTFDVKMSGLLGAERTGTHTLLLDEFEKSVFLTEAQEELITSLYNGRNSANMSFEQTEELRKYLSMMYLEAAVESEKGDITKGHIDVFDALIPEDPASYRVNMDMTDKWIIVHEKALIMDEDLCNGGTRADVMPVTLDELDKISRNPFRGPNKRRVLRYQLSDTGTYLMSKYDIKAYHITYLRRPEPIILAVFDDGLALRGKTEPSVGSLDESLHRVIVDMAVQKALQTKGLLATSQANS